MQDMAPGIARRTRPPTEDEVRELLTPLAPARLSRLGCVMRAVGAGVPGVISAVLTAALVSNVWRAGAWGDRVFMASVALVLGPLALLLLIVGARNLWLAVMGPGGPRAAMSEATARGVEVEEITLRADGAWRVEMVDDGAPALLLRAGERCVFVRGGAVAGLLGDGGGGGEEADDSRGAPATVPGDVTIVVREGRARRVEARGAPVALGEVLVQERAPRRGVAWWQREVLEFGALDLPEGVRAQLRAGPAPGGN